MSIIKNAKLIYVAPIPKDWNGINIDVPAHVKVQWLDEQGRRCTLHLDLKDADVARVANLPDVAVL